MNRKNSYLRIYEYKNNKLFLHTNLLFFKRLKKYITYLSDEDIKRKDWFKYTKTKFSIFNRNKMIFLLENLILPNIKSYNFGYYNDDIFILCNIKKYNINNKILYLFSNTYEFILKKINIYYINVTD